MQRVKIAQPYRPPAQNTATTITTAAQKTFYPTPQLQATATTLKTTNQPPAQKKKNKIKNLCIFLGTTGQSDMHNLSDGFQYSVLSKYARVHANMSADELYRRLSDSLQTELDSSYEKLTFIYSGHGWRNGMSVNNDIVEYKDLARVLIDSLSNIKACQIYEIRVVLDCCYASSFASFLAQHLQKAKPIESLRRIRFVAASSADEVAFGLGVNQHDQRSPFFEYFFLNKSADEGKDGGKNELLQQNNNYRVTPKGKGVFLFEFGAKADGKYAVRSVAQRMAFERDKDTGKWNVIYK